MALSPCHHPQSRSTASDGDASRWRREKLRWAEENESDEPADGGIAVGEDGDDSQDDPLTLMSRRQKCEARCAKNGCHAYVRVYVYV